MTWWPMPTDLPSRAQYWGATDVEISAPHPAARYATPPYKTFVRAVDVEIDADTMYRWVCQLTVAPYSYDLLDNLGRRSPRILTGGADELALGQRFLIGRIVEVEPGRRITAVSTPLSDRIFGGPIVLTYAVHPTGPDSCRLVCSMAITARHPSLRRWALGWGDLVMMRKQLLTLKDCAERSAAQQTRDSGA